jgi:hydrogenase maturation protein HypF
VNTYEGEAAMKLEQYARFYFNHYQPGLNKHYFGNQFESSKILMQPIFENIIADIQSGKEKEEIAWLFHASMAAIIAEVARQSGIKKIAFSGGVFQNALLIDLVYLQLAKNNQIYIHRQLPPNDECISFGQIMHHQFIKNN